MIPFSLHFPIKEHLILSLQLQFLGGSCELFSCDLLCLSVVSFILGIQLLDIFRVFLLMIFIGFSYEKLSSIMVTNLCPVLVLTLRS